MGLELSIQKKLGDFCLNVDFQTGREIFALLGSSGCGKSMTLKCIAGIETPDRGRIVLDGKVLYDSQKKINLPPQKRKIGYMFQDYALFPNMTVEKNIKAGMGKKTDQNLVEKYLLRFRLHDLRDHFPSQLSGGQKQRVALARLLASDPQLILLDEPFSALDSYLKWELEQEMKEILDEVGKPVLFVSHNRDEVYRMCDTVGCLNHGRIDVVEPLKEFFHNPKTKTAAILSGCKNVSGIRIMDETHLYATDWKVVLEVGQIPKGTRCVGIRAHTFKPVSKERFEETEKRNMFNLFPVKEPVIWEDPFEWNISFCAGDDTVKLQWKFAKGVTEETTLLPDYLTVDSKDILLLQDNLTVDGHREIT